MKVTRKVQFKTKGIWRLDYGEAASESLRLRLRE